jgi:hypothetical protein
VSVFLDLSEEIRYFESKLEVGLRSKNPALSTERVREYLRFLEAARVAYASRSGVRP